MIARSRLGVFLAIFILLSGGLVAACGGGDDDDDGGNGGADDPAAAAAQVLFVEVGCAECHGEDAAGDGVNPRTNLVGTSMIIGQFRTRVRNGRGAAKPPFTEEQISDEEIEQLHEWLTSLDPVS